MTLPSSEPAGSWVLTGTEAAARAERSICGRAIAADPAVAEGLAMAGGRAASMSHAARAESARDLAASCVHHVGSNDVHASTGFQLAAGSAQEVVDQCLVAHRISQRLGSSGICSMDTAVAAGLGLVELPGHDVIASVLSAQPANGGSNEPGAMLAIAKEAFARVSEATGRQANLVERTGDDAAKAVIIGSGSRGVWAQQVATALTAAGHPTAALTMRLIHPLPAEELRSALGVATLVLLADGPATAELSSALNGIEAIDAGDGLIALEGRYPAEALERIAVGSNKAALPGRLFVAPAGPWADATSRSAIRALSARGQVQLQPLAERYGSSALQWSFGDVSRDVLIASGPEVLRTNAIDQLQPGAAVAMLGDFDSEQAFVDALSDAQRSSLAARKCEVFWMRGGQDAVGAAVPAILGLAEAQGLSTISSATLASPTVVEVQFHAAETRLKRVGAQDAEAHALWSSRIRSFHWRGQAPSSAAGPAPGLPLQPTVFEAIATLPSPYPLVVEAGAPLREVIAEASSGCGRVLSDNIDRLVNAIAMVLSSTPSDTPLETIFDAGAQTLVADLGLPEAEAAELNADLTALRTTLDLEAMWAAISDNTSIELHVHLANRARMRHRTRYAKELQGLAERIDEALLLHKLTAGTSQSDVEEAMSGQASMFDIAALAAVSTGRPGSIALSDDACARLQAALAVIRSWLDSAPAPVVCIHAPGMSIPLPASACRVHSDPMAAAIGFYDGLASETARLHSAAHTAQLDLDRSYDPSIHEAVLADFSWEGFSARELAIVPAVLAVCGSDQLGARGLGSMSMLIRSGRPVQAHITVEVGANADGDLPGKRDDIAGIAIAHREAVVVQTSLARPVRLIGGLQKMADALRPSVAVVTVPDSSSPGLRTLLAEASLMGRATSCFTFDPDSGNSWSDRLDLGGTPAPELPWPTSAVFWDEDGLEQGTDMPATWADRAALEPAYRDHFLVIPPAAWDENQVTLASYLESFEPEATQASFPYITVTDADNCLQRAIVTRALALVARDHQRAWRTLQELGGFDNSYVTVAADFARSEALSELEERVEQIEASHAMQLDKVRSDTARESMERLAAVLMNVDSMPMAAPRPTAAAPVAADVPPVVAEAPVEAEAPPAVEEEEEEEDDMSFDEAWIDSPMCTTCDECTNLNGLMFKYNGDKQAEIADRAAGTFADLVRSAEACPARCIHPGKAPAGDATVTDDLIVRAAEFN